MSELAAIILAAGGSTRLGMPKQLVEFAAQTLVHRAVSAALGAGCQPVVAVVGAQSALVRRALDGLDIEVVENADWSCGIGSSIRTGMQWLLRAGQPSPAGVLISLCDQPLVGPAALRALIDAWAARHTSICVSSYAGTLGPPVVAGAAFFQHLLALPDDQGAKALWQRYRQQMTAVPCPAGAIDIDTPTDLAALQARQQAVDEAGLPL